MAALVEVGVLCRGKSVPVGEGVADTGPHEYTGHNQLCRYESRRYQYPFIDRNRAAFEFYTKGMTMQAALGRTRLFVMLGAADSEELRRCLDHPDTIVLIFEPDERVLAHFLESLSMARLNRRDMFIFCGDPYSFDPALQDLLPQGLFELGTPAFFRTDRIAKAHQGWADKTVEYVEILHYRHAVYHISGQTLARSQPLRKIKRDLLYDRQLHVYENMADYLARPDISLLKGHFHGHSAIVVAAGPDLDTKLDYIRRNRGRAIVICVNNALKPLVEAGVRPHFVVINDTSIIAGEVFKHIDKQPATILVGHCLADLGGDCFRQKFLFGSHLEEIFGERDDLDAHGSVISAAYSLAVHMGCARCVFVGGQLASRNPRGLGYAQGTVKERPDEREKPLIHKHPQLYPAPTPLGDSLFTTLNFRDAALWLTEVIRLSGVECYNTSRDSLLHGPGITYDAEPELPEDSVSRLVAELFKVEPARPDPVAILRHMERELTNWTNIRTAAREIVQGGQQTLLGSGAAVLRQLDDSNVTFLLERFDDFDNRLFCRKLFADDVPQQIDGLRYYFENLERMSTVLLETLAGAVADCRRLGR